MPEIADDAYVMLRELAAKDLLALQKKHGEQTTGLDFAAEFLSYVLVDEDGKQLFNNAVECKDHITVLPISGLDRLTLAALKLSGLSGQQIEDAEPKN